MNYEGFMQVYQVGLVLKEVWSQKWYCIYVLDENN